MFYKIYTKINTADTCRDANNYVYTKIGNKEKLEDALKVANQYIQKEFFRKNIKLSEGKGNIIFTATDLCSYPETLIIKQINTKTDALLMPTCLKSKINKSINKLTAKNLKNE